MVNPSASPKAIAVSDKLMLGLAVVLGIIGITAFYFLDQQKWYVRDTSLIAGLSLGMIVALFSATGKVFIRFTRDAYREVCKVVWPTRKEAWQTTLIVFSFVLVIAIYLWAIDKTIEWLIFSLILRWK